MATTSSTTPTLSRNEVEELIRNELKTITDEYDSPFTQTQIDNIVNFIATDYNDRRLRIRFDIAVQHLDHIPKFLGYGYLNQMLDLLGQNTPLLIVENHIQLFSLLIRELKGYFDGALWLEKFENVIVKENEVFAEKLITSEKYVKELFKDRLKAIEEERRKCLADLQVKNALSDFPPLEGEEISDDALIEYLVCSDVIKCIFDQEFRDVEDMMREVRSEVKPYLGYEAKDKLESLWINVFSRNIIQKKAEAIRSTSASTSASYGKWFNWNESICKINETSKDWNEKWN